MTTTVQLAPAARVVPLQPSEVMPNPVPLTALATSVSDVAELTLVIVNVARELDPTGTVP